MPLTRYGLREIVATTVLAWGACALLGWAALSVWPWLWAPAALPLLVWLWALWFFRDPERRVPDGEGLFISPADGRVADVTPLGPDSPLGRNGVRVGVFMSIFDVHVNRMPCDGRVQSVTHRPGVFLDARRADAPERNESATIVLTCSRAGREHPVAVRQVAGRIARRIVTDLTPGQEVSRGRRFGMIKWGSRLELLLPDDLGAEVCVRVGQRVRAGQTVLAAVKVD